MDANHELELHALPEPLWIQQQRGLQYLNMDLVVKNQGAKQWTLRGLELLVLDADAAVIMRRRLDEQAASPSIATLPERTLAAGGALYLFNPLPPFDGQVPLQRLCCRLHFTSDAGDYTVLETDLSPRHFSQRTDLILPLAGPAFIDDGNDYYSHHRRLPLNHPLLQAKGFTGNAQRYAWDFMPVDERGLIRPGAGLVTEGFFRQPEPACQNEDYVGFGAPIRAPGDGQVLRACGDVADNPPWRVLFTEDQFATEPWLVLGNYVVIDHGHDEYSMLAHCRQGSVTVRPGDRVRQGDVIGALGNSGWTYVPHLHYQVIDNADYLQAEGLPVRFGAFTLRCGATSAVLHNDAPATGEVVVG